MDPEELAYNSIALFFEGDLRRTSEARRGYDSWQKTANGLGRRPEEDQEELEILGLELILKEGPRYPGLLREIPHAPHALYIKGRLPQEGPCLSLVGTRKATPEGIRMAKDFAASCSRAGLTIVSGMALGIDTAAHTGALEGRGRTIAVLPCGLDRIYPASNQRLAEKILEGGGALISEYPPHTPPRDHRFLARNRIVSGLSAATLIIEAPLRSGCMTTARFALDQDREVFVVPGPILHRNFEGSNRLLREGARLVTTPEDVLEDLGHEPRPAGPDAQDLGPDEAKILQALKTAGRALSIDEILETTNLLPRTASRNLTLLLLKGQCREEGGGYNIVL